MNDPVYWIGGLAIALGLALATIILLVDRLLDARERAADATKATVRERRKRGAS